MPSLYKEPVTIFSDFHVAHPGSMIKDTEQVKALLPGSGTVIFNGDTVEMRSVLDRDEGRANRDKLLAMCEERGLDAVFLTGNHDLTVSDRHYVELYDGEVLITHGDILFHAVTPWSHESGMIAAEHTRLLDSLGPEEMADFDVRMKVVKQASGILEKFYVAKRSLGSVARNILREFTPPWRPLSVLWYWKQAPDRAIEVVEQFKPKARFILIGHLHRSGIWLRGDRVIINTGCFFPFVGRSFLQIENGVLRVFNILKKGNDFVPGPEVKSFKLKNTPAS